MLISSFNGNHIAMKMPNSHRGTCKSESGEHSFLKKILSIYLTEREIERASKHKQGEQELEKQTPCSAGSPMRDLIPRPQDLDLSPRQMLNQLSHPDAMGNIILTEQSK